MIILSGGEQPAVEAYFKKRSTMKPPIYNARAGGGGHIKNRDGRLTERQKQQIIADHLPLQYLDIEAEIDPFEINRSFHKKNSTANGQSQSQSGTQTQTHGLSIHDIRTHIARANLDEVSLLDCHDSTNIPQKAEELSRAKNFAEINDSNIAPANNVNILGNHINTSNYNSNLMGYHKWFDRYYKIALNMDISNQENIEQITDAYLRTLVWNFRYYFTDVCPNWDWYYPYNYPPVAFHIFKAVERVKNINNIKFLGSKPIEPQMLLIMVLPPESMGLMAADIRNKLANANNSLAVYFPAKYSISAVFHKYYHECPPNILRMDIKRVSDFYKSCKLTDEEKKRNITISG
jgi:5'-3' exonuclease